MKKLIFIFLAAIFFLPQFGWTQGCMEPSGDEGIQVIGFIQPQFQYDMLGTDIDGKNLDEASFYFNRARLGVMGTIPYDFSYYVMMEFSPTLNGGKNPQPPFLLDAFLSYNRFAPYVKVSVGQFKSPFSSEVLTPCHKLTTIMRARTVTELANPWRDMGLMISGGTGDLSIFGSKTENLFGYSFAIMNGTGINQWDNNLKKDYVARVTFHPIELITIGANYRFGKHPAQADGVTEDDQRKRLGFDVELKYKGFQVIGEYIHGSDIGSYTTGGGCGGDMEVHIGSKKREGYYVQAAYMSPWRLQPVVRFERYDPNLDMTGSDLEATDTDAFQNIWTYGLNYFFNDKVRIQLNYMYRAEENYKFEVDNDAFLMQFQLVF